MLVIDERDRRVSNELAGAIETLDLDFFSERRLAVADRSRCRPLVRADRLSGRQPPSFVLIELIWTDVARSFPDPLTGGIAVDDASGGIHDPDADRKCIQHRAEHSFSLAMRVLELLPLGNVFVRYDN